MVCRASLLIKLSRLLGLTDGGRCGVEVGLENVSDLIRMNPVSKLPSKLLDWLELEEGLRIVILIPHSTSYLPLGIV